MRERYNERYVEGKREEGGARAREKEKERNGMGWMDGMERDGWDGKGWMGWWDGKGWMGWKGKEWDGMG